MKDQKAPNQNKAVKVFKGSKAKPHAKAFNKSYKPNHSSNNAKSFAAKNKHQSQISEKLSELFKITQFNAMKQNKDKFHLSSRHIPALKQESKDGVDHINFFTWPETQLGALLATNAALNFTYPQAKKVVLNGTCIEQTPLRFNSLKCLWAYYRTGCCYPELATYTDSAINSLYKVIREFPKQDSVFAVLFAAYYEIFKQYPDLMEALASCELPFEYYNYTKDKTKKRSPVSRLMINGMNELRHAVKTGNPPRLESFLSSEDREKALNDLASKNQTSISYKYITEELLTQEHFYGIFEKNTTEQERLEFICKLCEYKEKSFKKRSSKLSKTTTKLEAKAETEETQVQSNESVEQTQTDQQITQVKLGELKDGSVSEAIDIQNNDENKA